jgi:hypothetical protein
MVNLLQAALFAERGAACHLERGDLKSSEVGLMDLSQSSHLRPRQPLDVVRIARQRCGRSLWGVANSTKSFSQE